MNGMSLGVNDGSGTGNCGFEDGLEVQETQMSLPVCVLYALFASAFAAYL